MNYGIPETMGDLGIGYLIKRVHIIESECSQVVFSVTKAGQLAPIQKRSTTVFPTFPMTPDSLMLHDAIYYNFLQTS